MTPGERADVSENTGNGEVLWKGACSHWHYFGAWLFGLIFVAASGAVIFLNREPLAEWMPWAYGVPVLLLVLLVILIAWKRAQRRYAITKNRVIVEMGIIVKDSNEIRVQDIRSINVTKRGIAGLIGIGTVEFSSSATDDADVIFVGIAGADAVRDLVRKLQS